MKYIVDISKPPISPPGITKRQGLFTYRETKESKEQNKAWDEYIIKYKRESKLHYIREKNKGKYD